MKEEKFTEFTERCLALGRDGGWEKEIKAKENLAWEIYERFPPTGGLLLGDLILQQGTSYLRREIGTKEFARELTTASCAAILELSEKDGWDYYYLGIAHQYGRGTPRNLSLAADMFEKASEEGNRYSKFEAIWARHLSGGSRIKAILDLTALRGKLADFAAYSARALTLLELGPTKELASSSHFSRLMLMHSALHTFIFHDQGQRQVNIAIEKELKEGIDELKALNTKQGNFALYLTEKASRKKRTGRDALDWFRDAVDPAFPELIDLCKCRKIDSEELRIIVEQAKINKWEESELATLAVAQLNEGFDY